MILLVMRFQLMAREEMEQQVEQKWQRFEVVLEQIQENVALEKQVVVGMQLVLLEVMGEATQEIVRLGHVLFGVLVVAILEIAIQETELELQME